MVGGSPRRWWLAAVVLAAERRDAQYPLEIAHPHMEIALEHAFSFLTTLTIDGCVNASGVWQSTFRRLLSERQAPACLRAAGSAGRLQTRKPHWRGAESGRLKRK